MWVAVSLFGNEVSPRFCFAKQALVVNVDGDRELERAIVDLGETDYPERLRLLGERGVTLVICGGFDRRYLGHARADGIHVIAGITGQAEDAVRSIRGGTLGPGISKADCWCHEPSTTT